MKTGLVLEGGGKRGIYAAGVLDVLLENDIWADGLIGTSAGAVNGCSYVSNQYERNLRYNIRFAKEKKYMSIYSLITTGNVVGTDFAYNILPNKLEVFDYDAFEKSPVDYYVTCSNVETGKAEYIQCKSLRGKNMDYLRASASLPYVSQIVEIDGKKYLDGGICDSIPLKAFQNMGYEKNLVVLTRPKGYIKKPENNLLANLYYRKYPAFVTALRNRYAVYNRTLKYIEQQEKQGNILVLRPSKSIKVGRMEQDPKLLKQMYELGKNDARQILDAITLFLSK
ncbi:patatin-like phospholipase family protein [Oscillospiraceae bacterium LCP25S3_E3]|nr:patatin family protein [Ruminococcus sp.]MDY2856132.1 patatin family protein [Oscillospiraceae bacterium]